MKNSLKIIYTSDVHGKLSSYDFINQSYGSNGLSRLSSYLKSLNEPYILIDNGDFLQGSPLLDFSRKNNLDNPVAEVMNYLKYDLANLGNHDFNFGLTYLKDFINNFNGDIICANIIDKKTNKSFFTPYKIIQINHIKIAFIGLTTEYIPVWEKPSNIEDLEFIDVVSTLDFYAKKLKNEVDLVVCLYHGGYEKNIETHESYGLETVENKGYKLFMNKDVPILLTGHQHVSTVYNKKNRTTLQTTLNAINFGEVTIHYTIYKNKVTIDSIHGELKSTKDFPIDNDLENLLFPLINKTNHFLNQKIGETPLDFTATNPLNLRIKKHPLFQLINNMQQDKTQAMISVASLPNDVKGFKGVITLRGLSETFIYENNLLKIKVTGKILKDALEKTASYFCIKDGAITVDNAFLIPKVEHYNYDIYDGIDYTIKVSNPIGKRIIDLTFNNLPIKDTDTFTLALNSYRASGGGNYDMFKTCEVIENHEMSYLNEALNYISKKNPFTIEIKDNFKVIK